MIKPTVTKLTHVTLITWGRYTIMKVPGITMLLTPKGAVSVVFGWCVPGYSKPLGVFRSLRLGVVSVLWQSTKMMNKQPGFVLVVPPEHLKASGQSEPMSLAEIKQHMIDLGGDQ